MTLCEEVFVHRVYAQNLTDIVCNGHSFGGQSSNSSERRKRAQATRLGCGEVLDLPAPNCAVLSGAYAIAPGCWFRYSYGAKTSVCVTDGSC